MNDCAIFIHYVNLSNLALKIRYKCKLTYKVSEQLQIELAQA